MKENLIFANTCGKIHADRVVFAFEHKEKQISIHDIKKVKTEAGIEVRSLLIILIPSAFLIFLYIINELDIILASIIWFLTIFFTAVSLLNVKKKFHIIIVFKDRSKKLKIMVSSNNRKDARKFADHLNRQLSKQKNPETVKLRDLAS